MNFQESTTILDACTKKSGSLLKAPRIYIYIYIYRERERECVCVCDPKLSLISFIGIL